MQELGNHDTFAVYRLPHEEHHYLVRPQANQALPFSELPKGEAAFVFHPFEESGASPALAFMPEEILVNPRFRFMSGHKGRPFSVPESDYIPLLQGFVEEIRNGDLHKAICSRVIRKDMPTGDLYPLLMRLKKQYPFAFVYLVNVPGVGCWMGATPEILLTARQQVGETVALAGTRPLSSSEDWSRKEAMEQQMVERYMANILIGRKMNFQKTGPFTVRAGRVMHLKTRFRFPLEEDWKGMALNIHPSPAVCGLPKAAAKDFILSAEPHDRAYYCGFLGPVNLHGCTDLFVNLRCMQVFHDRFALYVGGGITADSDPLRELDETRWKSRTMSDIIEEVYALEMKPC
jgi:isochorismate synthase